MPSRSAQRATGIVSAAAALAAAALLSSDAVAAPFEWKNAAGGTFATVANWNRTDGNPITVPPTTGDTATFNTPSTFTVTFIGSVANDVLNFNSGTVTFATTGGQKTYNLLTGLAQANITNGTLTLGASGGAITVNTTNLSISTGGTLQTRFGSDLTAANLKVGTVESGASSTLNIDGVGSTLSVSGATIVGANGGDGYLNIINQGAGTFTGGITLGDATSAGSLAVQSSATLTSGSLSLGAGSLLVDSSSTLTLSGAATFTLGSTSGVTSTATVNNATLKTGTGLTTINPTGVLNVTGASTFNLTGDLLVAGAATFAPNSLNWAASRTITVNTGGSLTLTNAIVTPSASTLHVAGGTVAINPLAEEDDTTLSLGPGASADVTAGGLLAPHSIAIGNGVTSTLTIDGFGSTLDATGSPYSSGVGTTTGNGVLTLRNGATAGFDNTLFVGSLGAAANGTINIQSGATLFAYDLALADSASGTSHATVNVTGAGSALVIADTLFAGSSSSVSAITVSSGASLVQGNTTMTPIGVPIGQGVAQLNRGLTLTIDGGFVSLGTVTADPGVITLTSGSLGFAGNLNIDSTGMLGYTVTLAPQQAVALTGATTIGVGGLLTLSGGSLATGSLVNNGTFLFTSGTLALTGTDGLAVSSTGPLGASPNLSPGKNLIITAATTIASTASLAITGGSLTTGSLTNSGSLTVNNYGSLTIQSTLVNASTGRLFLGPDLTALADGDATNAGRITLQGGSTRLVGSSPLTNTGLITGSGEIAKPLVNSPAGELRAETGKSLLISGPSLVNGGKLNLTGGVLEFSNPLTNSTTGQILGRGGLIANAGLTNNGQASFSGGLADVYGPVTNNFKILITGGATATFYDPFTNSAGADIFTAANSATVFLAAVTGAGTFSGPGTKYFSDGTSSTSPLEPGGLTVVSESASLSTPDFREQSITVNGLLTTSSPSRPSRTQSLTLGPTGHIDLGANPLILDYSSSSSPLPQLRQYLHDAQIFSSATQSNPLLAIGYAEASDLAITSWSDLPVDSTSLITKLTYLGDANLDGQITPDDYTLLDRSFAKALSNAHWTDGDFNYDGAITSADYLLIDTTFGQAQGFTPGFLAQRQAQFGESYVQALLTSIPEPSSLAYLLVNLPLLARRRKVISRCY